jgi:hypothetical protein
MRFSRRSGLGAAVALGVLALGAPIADAQVFPLPFVGPANTIGQANGPAGCTANSPAGVGFAGGTTANSCGVVLSFIGPAIGEVASVVGPTIIGPTTVLAPVVTSAGPTSGP